MTDFSIEKSKDRVGDWKSPAMHTHYKGYKFCIGVNANGCGTNRGFSINVEMYAMPGDYDADLKWPAQMHFTMEIVNQTHSDLNVILTSQCNWQKPCGIKFVSSFSDRNEYSEAARRNSSCIKSINNMNIKSYLHKDSLYFNITQIRC